jgi:polyisoprenoid-binding protein YceI
MTEQTTAASVLAGRWQLDPAQSVASFSVVHFGRPVDGTIALRIADAEIGPTGSIQRAHIELDLTAIATGNIRRERDLAKPRFLDTGRHPTLVVDVLPTSYSDGGWLTTAVVRARGAEAQLDIGIKMPDDVINEEAKVIVTGTLDRTPLGIKVPRFIIAKAVAIRVEAVFRRTRSH